VTSKPSRASRRAAACGFGIALAALLAAPAAADTRWLACKFNDAQGKPQSFHRMFDEARNLAAFFDPFSGNLVEGMSTYINFQLIRSRFPSYALTYNRNDGVLGLSPIGGVAFTAGLLHGSCQRSLPPAGAPSG
jgi:hypothetical protein